MEYKTKIEFGKETIFENDKDIFEIEEALKTLNEMCNKETDPDKVHWFCNEIERVENIQDKAYTWNADRIAEKVAERGTYGQVDLMKKDLQKVGLNPISLREFYIKAGVGWRDEFENWLLQYPIQKRENFCYEDWIRNYTEFAKNDERVLWIPFRSALTEFNFIVYKFKPDGFYEYIEYGEPFNEGDYKFVRVYRNRDDARYFVTDHNKHLREQNKEKAEKKLIEKVTNNLVSGTVSEPIKDSEAPKISIKLPKETLDWKEAMKALIDDKRIEARLCIPGLPESENGWFEVEFTSDQGFGESVKFGKDWDYRIKDDSKEREALFEECEKLGIIDITKISRVPTTLLYDIVNAFRSIDLNWKEIVKQVGEIG